jgi:hypothetical protein
MRSLRDLLIASGVTGLENRTLEVANAVSADGRTIVGGGYNPAGQEQGWIVTIEDEPLAGDANEDGVVDLADVAVVVMNYGTANGGTMSNGDFDNDGRITLLDAINTRNRLGDARRIDNASPSIGQPVPEPQTCILVLTAIVAFAALRTRFGNLLRTTPFIITD